MSIQNLSKTQQVRLNYVINLLNNNHISYIIIGGLATKFYGSKRKLADVDIGISNKDFSKIQNVFSSLIVENYYAGYKDDTWDLKLLVINYKGQEFDLFDQYSLKFFSKQTNKWETVSFNEINIIDSYNVLKRSELIRYKSLLSRDVDILDIEFLTKN